MVSIQLAVLDMAGTTVRDDGLVERAFDAALRESGVGAGAREAAQRHVRETMGQSKIEVFRALFPGDEERAQRGNAAFERHCEELAHECEPVPGAERVVRTLRESGVRTCLTTGFSRSTRQRLLDRLGWADLADLALSPEDAGRGRPHPDMVLTAVLRLRIDDVRSVAVVGDTGSDVLAGLRSGASVVAGVLTGAHDRATLEDHGATHVLPSVADLPDIVARDAFGAGAGAVPRGTAPAFQSDVDISVRSARCGERIAGMSASAVPRRARIW
ncbi:phosphonatase-like hydrolase [Saccharopolyspora rosea]